jgi:anti-sigma regulatory factor (Ser/Thr protein kinase)
MEALRIKALTDNLDRVLQYVDAALEIMGCSMKNQIQIDMAVEELFVNIAHYAYKGTVGDAVIIAGPDPKSGILRITFRDWGIPFDPLAKTDPDISLSVEEREIGGLGIFMVKKSMDSVDYEYKDGHNILRIKKNFQ